MSQFSTNDLVAVLSDFASEYMNKTDLVQSDLPLNLSELMRSKKEKLKLGFDLSLQESLILNFYALIYGTANNS